MQSLTLLLMLSLFTWVPNSHNGRLVPDATDQISQTEIYANPNAKDMGAEVNSKAGTYCSAKWNGSVKGIGTGSGCRIHVPCGSFTVATPIALVTGEHVIGCGRGKTILTLADVVNHSMFLMGVNSAETGYSTSAQGNETISDLTMDGNAAGQKATSYGIHVGDCSRCEVERLRIQNFRSHGIKTDNGSISAPGGGCCAPNVYDIDYLAAQSGYARDASGSSPSFFYCFGGTDFDLSKVNTNDLNKYSTVTGYMVWLRNCGDAAVHDSMFTGGQTGGIEIQGGNQITIQNSLISGFGGYGVKIEDGGGATYAQIAITNSRIQGTLRPADGGSVAGGIHIGSISSGFAVTIGSGNDISLRSFGSVNPNCVDVANSATVAGTPIISTFACNLNGGPGLPLSDPGLKSPFSTCLLGGVLGTKSPANCGAAMTGKVAVPPSQTRYTINASSVINTSIIFVEQTTDNSGLPSSPKCSSDATSPMLSSRIAGTSFTISLKWVASVTCFQYKIITAPLSF